MAGKLAFLGAAVLVLSMAKGADGLHKHCPRTCCPPWYHHCQEGPPRLKIHHACPRPIGNPCESPTWGYYQPCWNPWPFPPDWTHCPVTPPAAYVQPPTQPPGYYGPPAMPPGFLGQPGLLPGQPGVGQPIMPPAPFSPDNPELPAPRKIDNNRPGM